MGSRLSVTRATNTPAIYEHSFPHYFWNCLLNISRLDHPRVSFNVYYTLTYLQIYPRMPHNAGDICVALWLTWQVCRVTASLIIPCRWRFPRLLHGTGSGTRSERFNFTRITRGGDLDGERAHKKRRRSVVFVTLSKPRLEARCSV